MRPVVLIHSRVPSTSVENTRLAMPIQKTLKWKLVVDVCASR